MNYWLVKSEPDVYSFQQLQTEGISRWDGVRNYQARNNLRTMKKGDLCFFYHSNIGLEVVGIAEVLNEFYPDPTAEKGDWSAVDLVPYKALKNSVTLKEIKENPALQDILLVRNGRISVMPLTKDAFEEILRMSESLQK
jgi:predicted RNA-binding protein with PUA-like domain